ncbi:MAG TPA: amidohydrolase family protein [Mycobacteriales bacterium]|nr:amidohydrolase family protein [Mycobacteriales bacterium]
MTSRSQVAAPLGDEEVAGYWKALGLPGLIDAHVHFMPDSVLRKVWAYFASKGPLTGRDWPIAYKWDEQQRLDHLRAMGVRAFPSLVYAHKPDMAKWLNDWAVGFAVDHGDVIQTATMFPEPGVASYVDEALRAGARIVKVHVQVGGFDPRDPLLDPAWGLLADAGTPVVVHAGSGPTPGSFTGPGPIGEVLQRHPRLAMIAAHMGKPEYDEFLDFAEAYENVRVDTTMCFTDFGDDRFDGHPLAPRLRALQDKVLFGADFPNIPYAYAHQIEALTRLELGDAWMRAVLWDNASELFGIAA